MPLTHPPRAAAALPLAGLMAGLLVLGVAPALAADGHDHGDAPVAATGSALPRFAASSELYELVGVLDGQKLTLYLDHSADNAPVKDAQLALEIGGQKVVLSARGEGEYEATLAQALPEGISPVTATVRTPRDSDPLAGEIDLHQAAHGAPDEASHSNAKPDAHSRPAQAGWAVGGLAAVGLLAWAGRRLSNRRQAPAGSAA